jgi:phosphoglycolate phosphatase-like HAD superfamily hydrolase
MKTIVWDVDDVLNDLMRAWFEDWVSTKHAHCPLTYDQITGNPPHELLGISSSDYQASLDDYIWSRFLNSFYNALMPICCNAFNLDAQV